LYIVACGLADWNMVPNTGLAGKNLSSIVLVQQSKYRAEVLRIRGPRLHLLRLKGSQPDYWAPVKLELLLRMAVVA
jgi:hypothetical protein